jgi:TonB family protein
MARHHASTGGETQAFERLRARLGRLPTVEEMSREFGDTSRPQRRLPLASLGGLALVAVAIFLGQGLELPEWVMPEVAVPAPPAAPPATSAQPLPSLPTPAMPDVAPPPPPPVEAKSVRKPAARPVPAPVKAAAAPLKTAPAPARSAPAHAAVQRQVLPQIAASARRTITGRVQIDIRASVDEAGNVTAADTLSPQASRYFNAQSIKAAREWKFAPADAPRDWVLRFQLGRGMTTVTAAPATN